MPQTAQSRQSARLFVPSSELRLPHPLTRRRVCPPPPLVRGGQGGWGGPNSDEGTLWYSVFVDTFCFKQFRLLRECQRGVAYLNWPIVSHDTNNAGYTISHWLPAAMLYLYNVLYIEPRESWKNFKWRCYDFAPLPPPPPLSLQYPRPTTHKKTENHSILSDRAQTSVADPDPDPHVFTFWASWILLSSCKNSKKNLESYYFVTLFDFLSLKKRCKCTFKK